MSAAESTAVAAAALLEIEGAFTFPINTRPNPVWAITLFSPLLSVIA